MCEEAQRPSKSDLTGCVAFWCAAGRRIANPPEQLVDPAINEKTDPAQLQDLLKLMRRASHEGPLILTT